MWPFKKKELTKSVGGAWSSSAYSPNWFQKGETVTSGVALRSTIVYSCITILTNGVSKLKIKHYNSPEGKGRTELTGSDISALLNRPNPYQNRMDFIMNMMTSLLLNGNAYAFAKRDNDGKVISLHPLNSRAVQAHVTHDSKIWYSITQTDDLLTQLEEFVPQSEILHLKLTAPTHPLVGLSPLVACSLSSEAGMNIQDQSNTFFANKSKIGGYLKTPNKMSPEKAKAVGKAWSEGTNGLAAGKTALLDNEMTFESFTLTAVDSQVIQQYKMSQTDVANVYRVPFHMVDPEAPHNFETAEAVSRSFAASSLSFYINYIESAFNNFFDLDGTSEYVEFDVEAGIGRGDLKSRMDAYSTAIHGAIMTPNDARALENLEPKEGGDEVFLQLQDRPLSEVADEFRLKNEKVESEIGKLDAETENIVNPPEPVVVEVPTNEATDDDLAKWMSDNSIRKAA